MFAVVNISNYYVSSIDTALTSHVRDHFLSIWLGFHDLMLKDQINWINWPSHVLLFFPLPCECCAQRAMLCIYVSFRLPLSLPYFVLLFLYQTRITDKASSVAVILCAAMLRSVKEEHITQSIPNRRIILIAAAHSLLGRCRMKPFPVPHRTAIGSPLDETCVRDKAHCRSMLEAASLQSVE